MRTPAIVLAAVAMYAHSAAAQPTRVTECGSIRAPGSYVLARSLPAAGDCLVIEADFVTIDLAGFLIRGNGTGIGILAEPEELQGITLRNGFIANFLQGIFLPNASATVIEGIKAINNVSHGSSLAFKVW